MAVKQKLGIKLAKGESNEINIFNLGTLLQFETHSWQARKMLPKDIRESIVSDGNGGNWVSGYKRLINPKRLEPINSIIGAARTFVWDMSLPFPINGVHFIGNNAVDQVNTELTTYQYLLDAEVKPFAEDYQKWITEAKKILKQRDLFNKDDYPDDIKSRFSIEWRWFNMTIPDNITDEIREQETQRLHKLFEDTRHDSVLALKEGFAAIITHLSDTLNDKQKGENKRIRPEAIEKVHKFFETFQHKNIFDDMALEKMVNQAHELMTDLTPLEIRKDKDLEQIISDELNEIKLELNDSIETYKRKLTF